MYMKKHQRKSFVKKRLCNWNHVGTLKHLKIFSIQFSKISIYVHTEVYEKGTILKCLFFKQKIFIIFPCICKLWHITSAPFDFVVQIWKYTPRRRTSIGGLFFSYSLWWVDCLQSMKRVLRRKCKRLCWKYCRL